MHYWMGKMKGLKMTKISEYKGYEINYDSGSGRLFWCDVKGETRYQLVSEKEAQEFIDDKLKEAEGRENSEKEP